MSAALVPLASLLPHGTAAVDAIPPRVLLVEDDLLLLRALTRLLRASGCQVTQVGSGLVAAQMAKVRSFDVLLTDVLMPELGGLEVAARMREDDPALSVVLITGSPTVERRVSHAFGSTIRKSRIESEMCRTAPGTSIRRAGSARMPREASSQRNPSRPIRSTDSSTRRGP